MMKRVLVISVAVLFGMQAGFALAAATGNPDTGPGCGLGKLAWQNYPHQQRNLRLHQRRSGLGVRESERLCRHQF